jgi:hypothetical protein
MELPAGRIEYSTDKRNSQSKGSELNLWIFQESLECGIAEERDYRAHKSLNVRR